MNQGPLRMSAYECEAVTIACHLVKTVRAPRPEPIKAIWKRRGECDILKNASFEPSVKSSGESGERKCAYLHGGNSVTHVPDATEEKKLKLEFDKDFATARSHGDAQATNEHARTAAQSIMLVNGGAATAALAFAASYDNLSDWQRLLLSSGLAFMHLELE